MLTNNIGRSVCVLHSSSVHKLCYLPIILRTSEYANNCIPDCTTLFQAVKVKTCSTECNVNRTHMENGLLRPPMYAKLLITAEHLVNACKESSQWTT